MTVTFRTIYWRTVNSPATSADPKVLGQSRSKPQSDSEDWPGLWWKSTPVATEQGCLSFRLQFSQTFNWLDVGQVLNCSLLRNNCAFPHAFRTNEIVYWYHPPTKLREGNVFSPVCLCHSVCSQDGGLGPLDIFKLVQLGPHRTHCNSRSAPTPRTC